MTTTKQITSDTAFEPENRVQYLGGTDISAILGFNPYKTAYECYLEKTGQPMPERPKSSILEWGHRLEQPIAEVWLEKNPDWEIVSENEFCLDPEYDFLAANIDRVIRNKKTGELAILECKTVASSAYKNWKLGVPITYYTQVQHYLGVKGFDRAIFAMLIMDSREDVSLDVIRDDAFINETREKACEFWDNKAIGIEPDKVVYDWSQDRDTKKEVVATAEQETAFNYLKKAKGLMKRLKDAIEVQEEILKLALQDKSILRNAEDKVLCSWNGSDVNRVDTDKLKKEFPEIYMQVIKTKFERKFLTK